MKVRRSIYNLIVGLISQFITIALGFIIPRLFLVNFGSEINGLLSSINQVFIYLSLLEAGVGLATTQSLYLPISQNNKQGINSTLSASAIFYRKTGVYYVLAVVIFAATYPSIVKTNLNFITVFTLILLSGLGSSINYLFQGKYKLLLNAEGKGYIVTSITTVINVLISSMKIILLLMGYNIIVIQMSYFIIMIFQMAVYNIYIKKKYSWIDLNVEPNFKSIEQKNSVLVHQISSLIFSNTDVLVLTVFCGLKVVSVYVMYSLVFNMIESIIFTFNNSISSALGQCYAENKERYFKIYESYELYFIAGIFSLLSVAYVLVLPFMKLYTSGVTDINYIDYKLPVFFVILKLLSFIRSPGGNAINVAGHFKETQNRAVIESLINIIFSLVFVNIYGIYGVLMGTIVALLYRTTDIIVYSNKQILKRNTLITIKRCAVDAIIFIITVYITKIIKIDLNSYGKITIYAIIFLLVESTIYFTISSLLEIDVYKYTVISLKKYIGKYLGKNLKGYDYKMKY